MIKEVQRSIKLKEIQKIKLQHAMIKLENKIIVRTYLLNVLIYYISNESL